MPSDHDYPPADLFDAVCQLDDIAEWLEPDYPEEAQQLSDLSGRLKGDIVISLKPGADLG